MIVLYDEDRPQSTLCVIVSSENINISEVNDIVAEVKSEYEGVWTTEDIIQRLSYNTNWTVYDYNNIRSMGI